LDHGYYSPEELDHLGEGSSVLELVESWAPTPLVPQVRNLLGAFLFRDDEVYKSVTVLSGGERSRLALLRLLLHPAAALFLDEPTNHLDLQSKDVLLETLRRYQGTVVFVSHDRLFIEGLATRVVELREGRARLFPGDYAYYLWRTQSESQEQEAPAPRPAAAKGAPTASQASRLEDKRLQRELRRLAREEEGIVADLEGLHGQRSELERSLAREEVYRDGERVRQVKRELEEIERREEALSARWEELEEERRQLTGDRGVA
jgi:ATP-binding cassette subfamily F protein 3